MSQPSKPKKRDPKIDAKIEQARAFMYGPILPSNINPSYLDVDFAFARDAAMRKFLVGMAKTGVMKTGVDEAAEAGIKNPVTGEPFTRGIFSDWRRDYTMFAAAWDEAAESAYDDMEAEAKQRGQEGSVEETFYDKDGQVVATKKRRSDTLLMFMLNGRRSGVFRNRTELSGPNGGPLQIQLGLEDARAKLAARIQAKIAGEVAAATTGGNDAGPTET